MSDGITTVRMPTRYLLEKVEHLVRLTDRFDGGNADVSVWWLREIAETAEMIRGEGEWWIAEAVRRAVAEEDRENSGGETP